MALTPITPTQASVRWDHRSHQPSSVRVAGMEIKVTAVDAIRDETAAYRAERGPRITYLVASQEGHATLVFDARRKRWFVEAIDLAA